MISPANSRAVGRIIARTGRTFSKEVNTIVAERLRQNGVEEPTEEGELTHATA